MRTALDALRISDICRHGKCERDLGRQIGPGECAMIKARLACSSNDIHNKMCGPHFPCVADLMSNLLWGKGTFAGESARFKFSRLRNFCHIGTSEKHIEVYIGYVFIWCAQKILSCSLAVEGHSIYIGGLPLSATDTQLEEEFKKFGAIKPNGIQVRSNKVCHI